MTVLTVVVACAVIAGGATGLTAIVARTSRRATVHSLAASCVAPQASPAGVASDHLGAWTFNLLEAGTFGSVVSATSGLYALQACGTEETELRVLRIDTSGKVLGVSADFKRAALLTSSLAIADGSLYVGTAQLDISGPGGSAPYDLTLYRLDLQTLRVLGSRSMGRGYGLSLFGGAGARSGPAYAQSLLASTGEALLAVSPDSLQATILASFGGSIGQRVSVEPGLRYVAVSLFSPGAVPPAATASIELFDLASRRVVSSVQLKSGSDVESLALGRTGLWASIGDGMSTQLWRYTVPALGASGAPTGVPATLQTIDLSQTGDVVWLWGSTLLGCADASTGRLLASTTPAGSPSASVSATVEAGSDTVAVTPAGIGTVGAPTACRGARS
jgi:hypothetical protein